MNLPNPPRTGIGALDTWLARAHDFMLAGRLQSGPDYDAVRGTTGTGLRFPRKAKASLPVHPFQLYKVSRAELSVADKEKPDVYAIRSGLVEIRPKWISLTGTYSIIHPGNNAKYHNYFGNALADDVVGTFPLGHLGISGEYYALDATPEISGGINYGAYYAFWIEIDDATPNAAPTVAINKRKLSAFDGLPLWPNFTSTKEVVPIALLQLVQAVGAGWAVTIFPPAGIGISPAAGAGDGQIIQYLMDHYTHRYDNIGLRWQGEFDKAQYRRWYVGDVVWFVDSPSGPLDGLYICEANGGNGAAVLTPNDPTAVFVKYSPF